MGGSEATIMGRSQPRRWSCRPVSGRGEERVVRVRMTGAHQAEAVSSRRWGDSSPAARHARRNRRHPMLTTVFAGDQGEAIERIGRSRGFGLAGKTRSPRPTTDRAVSSFESLIFDFELPNAAALATAFGHVRLTHRTATSYISGGWFRFREPSGGNAHRVSHPHRRRVEP